MLSLASAMELVSVASAMALLSVAFWCGRLSTRVEEAHVRTSPGWHQCEERRENYCWIAKQGEVYHTHEDCGCLRQSKAVKRMRMCAVCARR